MTEHLTPVLRKSTIDTGVLPCHVVFSKQAVLIVVKMPKQQPQYWRGRGAKISGFPRGCGRCFEDFHGFGPPHSQRQPVFASHTSFAFLRLHHLLSTSEILWFGFGTEQHGDVRPKCPLRRLPWSWGAPALQVRGQRERRDDAGGAGPAVVVRPAGAVFGAGLRHRLAGGAGDRGGVGLCAGAARAPPGSVRRSGKQLPVTELECQCCLSG